MHLDVHSQQLRDEQMLENDETEKKLRPRRKSSFRRMYEVCDRMVQLYFTEGDQKFSVFVEVSSYFVKVLFEV